MRRRYPCALAALLALAIASPQADASDSDPALSELVEILRKEGVLDDAQYSHLAAKASAAESEESWTDRVRLWGDFRGRYENFAFFDDPINGNSLLSDRHRFRIRLRLNARAEVNDYANLNVRLVTGNDSRTTNETLGAGLDFDKFDIFLDRAYIRVSPFREGALPDGQGTLWMVYGLTPQPWRWDDVFKDWLLWDDELSPQGGYVDTRLSLGDALGLRAHGGVYIFDENSGQNPANLFPAPTSQDPKMGNIGLRLDGDVDERLDLGGRVTWYHIFDLDAAFINRGVDSRFIPSSTFAAGNIPGGLTGDLNGGSLNVINLSAYAKLDCIERWPITLLFDFSRNLDASSSFITYPLVNPPGTPAPIAGTFTTGDQGNAWLVGISVGDTKEIVRFRMHYAWLEANAFPAQFVDSDLFDQFTNRKGWVWDFSKRIFTDTDASLTMFWSDPIKTNPAYQNSLYGSRRFRMQANLVWSF